MPIQLYYTPTSCGFASYLLAHKAGLIQNGKVEAFEVSLQSHTLVKTGADFYKINPKGNVPTVVLEDGTILNENGATLLYLGDITNINPPAGSSAKYALSAKLSYVATELHQTVGHLFNPTLKPEVKEYFLAAIKKKFTFLNDVELKDKRFLVGNSFTAADSYLYVVLSWSPYLGLDLDQYPAIKAYFEGIKALDFVQAAHKSLA